MTLFDKLDADFLSFLAAAYPSSEIGPLPTQQVNDLRCAYYAGVIIATGIIQSGCAPDLLWQAVRDFQTQFRAAHQLPSSGSSEPKPPTEQEKT